MATWRLVGDEGDLGGVVFRGRDWSCLLPRTRAGVIHHGGRRKSNEKLRRYRTETTETI